ncbi:unnamed protein product [Didymodactylos carnosus]|uniref:Uncharacterized protein n=1 Tax=Didymodactylos carnosus TaxID=1234261 RepID=A0A8S2MUF5_9BILA|nr:unnamed protein product [Didymodactylos carnosus]CAF3971883.1 unnamed protein product [Didymodactylos carnosus]
MYSYPQRPPVRSINIFPPLIPETIPDVNVYLPQNYMEPAYRPMPFSNPYYYSSQDIYNPSCHDNRLRPTQIDTNIRRNNNREMNNDLYVDATKFTCQRQHSFPRLTKTKVQTHDFVPKLQQRKMNTQISTYNCNDIDDIDSKCVTNNLSKQRINQHYLSDECDNNEDDDDEDEDQQFLIKQHKKCVPTRIRHHVSLNHRCAPVAFHSDTVPLHHSAEPYIRRRPIIKEVIPKMIMKARYDDPASVCKPSKKNKSVFDEHRTRKIKIRSLSPIF